MLSTYLAVRGALLTQQIDNEAVGEYEKAKLAFRQSFATRVIEHTVLAHPAVLPSVHLAEWDAVLDAMAERGRKICLSATLVVSVAAAWALGPSWPLASVLTWLTVKRGLAWTDARRINRGCGRHGWDVPTLLADLPTALAHLKVEAAPRDHPTGSHRARTAAGTGLPLHL